MRDLVVEILKIVAPVSVGLIVFAQGLGIAPSLVGTYFKERPGLMLRALVAALVLVPAAALALILVLKPTPGPASPSGWRSWWRALRPHSGSRPLPRWEEAVRRSWPACT